MKKILSGIQPSGELHLGNYFGAIKQYLEMQEEHECYFFVANYHAMTTIRDGSRLREQTFSVAADYLALGLDPEKAAIFVQSELPEVTELSWLLSTVTPMGLLERCHAYRDKISQGHSPDHGLFAYPVLMAADILIQDADLVPVGQDQKQHVEVTRDIAQKFNHHYGREVFKLPESFILGETAVVPGIDGRKMSKSYGNTLPIFAAEDDLKDRIMSIQTDSKPLDAPKDPDQCNLFAIFKLFASEEEREEVAEGYRQGGLGYGEVKKRLCELVLKHFAEARERRQELEEDPDYVRDVLRDGVQRARENARPVFEAAREAAGC